MDITLILVGAACMIAAIIGGGVKLSHLEIRRFGSLGRQMLLFVFGLAVFVTGLAMALAPKPGGSDVGAARDDPVQAVSGKGSPADRTAAAAGRDADEEAGESAASDVPGVDVTGLWDFDDGTVIRFAQTGSRLKVTGYFGGQSFDGRGKIDADDIEWDVGAMDCTGDIMDPSTILATCRSPLLSGTAPLRRRR